MIDKDTINEFKRHLPADATNKDILDALFNDIRIFDEEWWNTPYKAESEE